MANKKPKSKELEKSFDYYKKQVEFYNPMTLDEIKEYISEMF